MSAPVVVVHLDESCLGNGREGSNPGGAGALVEVRARGGLERRDLFLSEPATTNNRMALTGAAAVLEALSGKDRRLDVLLVSDSEYLVKGMREWVPGWIGRNWTRKGGPIENLDLWKRLVAAARRHACQWTWVRGHKGHAKNEYANDLAIRAAREQAASAGLEPSGFPAWLEAQRARKLYLAYDPDEAFTALEERVLADEIFPLRESR